MGWMLRLACLAQRRQRCLWGSPGEQKLRKPHGPSGRRRATLSYSRAATTADALGVTGGRFLGVEEFGLRGDWGDGFATGDADYAEDGHFGEGSAWHEDAGRAASEIRGDDLNAGVEQGEQVVGHDALDGFVIVELEADPKAIELGTAEECLSLGREVSIKFADEIDGADVLDWNGPVFA